MDLSQLPSVILLCLGFGFVIFWHELGHFLAAKWAGVKVEQFAVGFGQALFAWRKGLGWHVGTTQPAYEKRVQEYVEARRNEPSQAKEQAGGLPAEPTEAEAAAALGLGETEYRLNWIPLGGYVKMLGQDDMNPNAESQDPRAYNNQSIPKRMVIVSAGVIMNIILAALGFMVLFLIGFDAPPAVVGSIVPDSPAAHTIRTDGTPAPLRVGDRILYLDGKYQHDFTKIMLNTALLEEGAKIPMYVERRDGTKEHLLITPARLGGEKGLLMLGINQPLELKGPAEPFEKGLPLDKMLPADATAVRTGDTIVAVNGTPVRPDQYYVFNDAVQQSHGQPVQLTIKDAAGATRTVQVHPHFIPATIQGDPAQFAGMTPRAAVSEVQPDSPVLGKILPGDVFLSISSSQFQESNPSPEKVREWLNKAGQLNQAVDIQVLRGDKVVDVKNITPDVKLDNGHRGLNVGLGRIDEQHPVVAAVADNSPAKAAGVPAGATLTAVNGKPVHNWFDVQQAIAAASPDKPLQVAATTESGDEATYDLKLTPDQIATVANYQFGVPLHLHELSEPRKTSNPLVAAKWGVTETRDFTIQFYLTIKRMVQGSVSYTNMMGPVGIFHAGTKLAYKGTDWLIWFLSMISANLAVVNFLPIPIVDGGLFTFLIVEKLRGKPLSPYAQQVAQFVGLAVLLGVFLLVTYQDITRLF